uniref:Headcase domain-containing protein n=1 Tax=Macrostomum lignano TaxID=282301 RepID=A0A1I8IDV2_9PLAT
VSALGEVSFPSKRNNEVNELSTGVKSPALRTVEIFDDSARRSDFPISASVFSTPLCANQHCASVQPCQVPKFQQHVDHMCLHQRWLRWALAFTQAELLDLQQAIPSSCTCHLGIHACIEHGYREWHGAEAANGNSVAFNRQSLLYQSQLPPSQHRHHTQLPLPPPPPRLLMYRTRSDESLSMSGYKVKTQAEKTRMQLAMQSGLPGGGPQFGRRGPAVASMTPTSESISPTSPPSSGGGGRGVTTVPVDQAMAWRKANRADDNRQRPVDSPTSANGISILKAAASDSSSVVVTSAMANSESLGSQLHQQRQPDSQEGAAAAAAVAPVQQPPVDKDGTANSGSSQRFKADQSSEMSMEQKIYLDPKLRFL